MFLKALAKCVLILLRLTAAASATDVAIHKKMFESSLTTLIISKEEMEDIKKIVKDSGLLIKSLSEPIKNGTKLQKAGFLSMSLGTLGAFQKEPKFNGVYSRNNLTKIKDGAYIINLDEYETIATHWMALYVNNNNNLTYFDSFGVENIPKEIRKFIGNKNIIANIYRIQAYNSVMCGYFCIGFSDFMLKGKRLSGYINSFCSDDYQKNHKIILKYFQ